jgi:hypothetical protein
MSRGNIRRYQLLSRIFGLIVVTCGTSGCAALFQSVSDRAIMSDELDADDVNKLKSQTGDRRLVRVVRIEDDDAIAPQNRFIICPEPFAGAIIARGASSGLTVTAYGSASDAVTQTASAVDQRTDVVRLHQDAAFQWCMVRASGDIDGARYVQELEYLDWAAFEALKTKGQPDEDCKKVEAQQAQNKQKKGKEAAAVSHGRPDPATAATAEGGAGAAQQQKCK